MDENPDLQMASQACRLLADSTRLRLLLLLDREELSVAELAAITQLAQPRVSTHLAKLREAQLVIDRREGVFVYYRLANPIANDSLRTLWEVLRANTQDPLVEQDLQRVPQVIAARSPDVNWAETVAGDMERHYSPGRTWEATARALTRLLNLGDVLDIASGDGVLAELLAPHARHITCLDISERVVQAGKQRVERWPNVAFELGDMHELPVEDESQDLALLMHALTFTRRPKVVFREISRVLRPGGELLTVTLNRHRHEKAVEPYNHLNLGFEPRQLLQFCRSAGLEASLCEVTAVEKRAPNFGVITLHARKPA